MGKPTADWRREAKVDINGCAGDAPLYPKISAATSKTLAAIPAAGDLLRLNKHGTALEACVWNALVRVSGLPKTARSRLSSRTGLNQS